MKPSERLWGRAYAYLLARIRAVRAGENRLESEEELAQQLSVSRATVREATQVLTREGYLTRWHGKGIFAHPSVDALRHRMDLTTDFLRLLDTGAGAVHCQVVRSGFGPCGAAMARRFPIPCDSVYEQEWLYQVDETPMIFCKVSLPSDLLQATPGLPTPGQSLADWIAHYCGRDSAYYAAHLGCRADPGANWALRIPPETVVQNWQEILYDLTDTPVAFCDIFFHPEYMDLSMVLRP